MRSFCCSLQSNLYKTFRNFKYYCLSSSSKRTKSVRSEDFLSCLLKYYNKELKTLMSPLYSQIPIQLSIRGMCCNLDPWRPQIAQVYLVFFWRTVRRSSVWFTNRAGTFCVEFICSPSACMDFLQVLRLSQAKTCILGKLSSQCPLSGHFLMSDIVPWKVAVHCSPRNRLNV